MSFSERDRVLNAIDQMSDDEFATFKEKTKFSEHWKRERVKRTIDQWAMNEQSAYKLNAACQHANVLTDAEWQEHLDIHAIEIAKRQAEATEHSASAAYMSASSAKWANLISVGSLAVAVVALIISITQCVSSPKESVTTPAAIGGPADPPPPADPGRPR
jgi:hypothetical protein